MLYILTFELYTLDKMVGIAQHKIRGGIFQ